ncbi:MAG TPA: prolipoprotein diacylglyceryl transferase, partial [Limnochordia bacterium]
MLVDWDAIAFSLGPFAVHWYGILMAASIAFGFYVFHRKASAAGYDEEFIYNIAILTVLGGIIGARAIFVLTNWDLYVADPIGILRIDRGGLSFHGGLLGGVTAGGLYAWRRGAPVNQLADWAVPGLIAGIVLVRIGNIFNQEVLGR